MSGKMIDEIKKSQRHLCPHYSRGHCAYMWDECWNIPSKYCKQEEEEMKAKIDLATLDNSEKKVMALVGSFIDLAKDNNQASEFCDRVLNNVANRIAMYHEEKL